MSFPGSWQAYRNTAFWFQDIIDLFSTTPKAKGQEEEQEAEQIDQTETEESRQSEKKVEENQTETMEDELNFEFDMEELLKKESVWKKRSFSK